MLCISVCVKAAGCSREEKDGKKKRQDTEGKKEEGARTSSREGGRKEDWLRQSERERNWERTDGGSSGRVGKTAGRKKKKKKGTMDRGHPQNQMASV